MMMEEASCEVNGRGKEVVCVVEEEENVAVKVRKNWKKGTNWKVMLATVMKKKGDDNKDQESDDGTRAVIREGWGPKLTMCLASLTRALGEKEGLTLMDLCFPRLSESLFFFPPLSPSVSPYCDDVVFLFYSTTLPLTVL